jgi:hypothetical protein
MTVREHREAYLRGPGACPRTSEAVHEPEGLSLSAGGAPKCSPRRKPWESQIPNEQSTVGATHLYPGSRCILSDVAQLKKTAIRRTQNRNEVTALLRAIAEGTGDTYECYRRLYVLWCSNNSALLELKPLFRIPGIDAGIIFRVDDAFRATVKTLAAQILPLLSQSENT